MSLITMRPIGRTTGPAHVISQSCRFNDNDSARLSWSPNGSGDNTKVMTASMWVKRSALGSVMRFFDAGGGFETLYFRSDDKIGVLWDGLEKLTTQHVFRDVTAWYHIAWRIDTTQGTASDRLRLYVNGQQITDFDTENQPAQNDTPVSLNQASSHGVGAAGAATYYYFDGYMAEVVFIDGQSLDPTSFGEFDKNSNWVPTDVSGLTFGTNGFHLDYADSGNLGNDVSGNNNDFTASGLTSADQVLDSPTNDATNDVGNYCVMNVLDPNNMEIEDGALRAGAGGDDGVRGTLWVDSGKWFFEMEVVATGSFQYAGISEDSGSVSGVPTLNGIDGFMTVAGSGNKIDQAGTSTAYGVTWETAGDKLGVAYDADTGAIWFAKDGVWMNSATQTEIENANTANAAFTSISGLFSPVLIRYANTQQLFSFGQTGYEYTKPSGFKSLCTCNFADPTIPDPTRHFETIAYTGDGNSGREINGLSFRPDMIWFKQRSLTDQHWTHDVIRGADHYLSRPGNSGSTLFSPNEGCQSFDADGFTLGNHAGWNQNAATYVAWCWKAGGAGVTNNDGSITATISVNTTAGFSIAKYTTPSGTAAYTVGHGLGVKPAVVIYKDLENVNTWQMWHQDLTGGGADKHISPSTTAAEATSTTIWNNTEPTASVFGGKSGAQNADTDHIAYIWAEVDGFSRFGRYQGNNAADGPFVYCGFRPALVWIKRINGVGDWFTWDNKRSPANVVDKNLWLSLTTTETTADSIDLLANGFKLRRSGTGANGNGDVYIFAAFAEAPFKYARAR